MSSCEEPNPWHPAAAACEPEGRAVDTGHRHRPTTREVLVAVSPESPDAKDDDVRRKFREALERKHEQRHASAKSAEHDGSNKSHGTAGPTKGPGFRRKTG